MAGLARGRRQGGSDGARKQRRRQAARTTGSQRVHEALRRAIIALELEPGSALEEGLLCRQFKVSRTPVREALIRLASEGLVELQPNRGARVAALQFIDVVDHYEAMEVFQPVACHFAAVRRTPADLREIKRTLAKFCTAVRGQDRDGIIRFNYDLHAAIAAASHNRCIERGYRQMLADKLRLAQHGLPASGRGGTALADRFSGTMRLSRAVVDAIGHGDGQAAERCARELNAYVRAQVMDVFSARLAQDLHIAAPARRPGEAARRSSNQVIELGVAREPDRSGRSTENRAWQRMR